MNEFIISNKSDLVAIADAIRNKTEISESLAFPDEFISSITSIKGDGANDLVKLVEKTITSISNSEVTKVGNYALNGCSSLTSVDFPNATSIGNGAFTSCNLQSIYFPNVKSVGANAFQTNLGLKTVNLPNVTSISQSAFQDCRGITTVIIPKCTYIGNYAFYTASQSFKTLLLTETTTVCTLGGSGVFVGSPIANGTGYVYVPDELVDDYKTATNWSAIANSIKSASEYVG
jgi:hypothetical protein